jgi:hypothetical protein
VCVYEEVVSFCVQTEQRVSFEYHAGWLELKQTFQTYKENIVLY